MSGVRRRDLATCPTVRPLVRRMYQMLSGLPAGPWIPVIYKHVGESVIYTATVRPA